MDTPPEMWDAGGRAVRSVHRTAHIAMEIDLGGRAWMMDSGSRETRWIYEL